MNRKQLGDSFSNGMGDNGDYHIDTSAETRPITIRLQQAASTMFTNKSEGISIILQIVQVLGSFLETAPFFSA